jgi:hypothetical protein
MSNEIGNPDVSSYGMNTLGRANMIKIALATSGLLNAVVSMIFQTESRATASAAGTPTQLQTLRLAQFAGQVTLNGQQLAGVVSAEISVSNNLETIDVIRPDGVIDDADPGKVSATGQLVTRFSDTSLIDLATAETPVVATFGWSGVQNMALTVTLPRVFLPKSKIPVAGPQGIQLTFPFQASKDPTLGYVAQFVLVNDVANYTVNA